jgi:hypothetical protein
MMKTLLVTLMLTCGFCLFQFCVGADALTNGVSVTSHLRFAISDDILHRVRAEEFLCDTEVEVTNRLFAIIYNSDEVSHGLGTPDIDSRFSFRLIDEAGKAALKTKFGITKHIPGDQPIPLKLLSKGLLVGPGRVRLNEWYSISDLFQVETNRQYVLEVQLCHLVYTNNALYRHLSPPVRVRVKPAR